MIKHFLFCLFLLLPSQAFSATYYLSTSGVDGAGVNGAIGTPWATFNYAGTRLAAGDTLLVRGGNYVENVLVTNFTDGTNWTTGAITVANYPAETVWIRPSSGASGVNFNNTTYHIWTGIGIDGINLDGTGSAALYIANSSFIRYQDATIKDAFWSGIGGGVDTFNNLQLLRLTINNGGRQVGGGAAHGIYLPAPTSAGVDAVVLIEGCVIYGFDTEGNESGIQIYNGTSQLGGGFTIVGNILRNNNYGTFLSDTGTPLLDFSNNIVIDNDFTGVSLYNRMPSGAYIYNNTIDNNGEWGIVVGDGGPVGNTVSALIKNNAITNNINGPIRIRNISALSKATITFNDFNGNGNGNAVSDENSLSTISNNITSAPGYVGAPNYALATGSALRDAGTSDVAAIVTADFINTTRPQNGVFDIGAYEYFVAPSGVRILIIGALGVF